MRARSTRGGTSWDSTARRGGVYGRAHGAIGKRDRSPASYLLTSVTKMPAVLRWSIALFVVAVVGAQAVRPARTNPPSTPSASLLPKVPAQVSGILSRACRDCHSNDTRWPWYSNVAPISWFLIDHITHGRDHFNYSEWTTYSGDDQDKLLGSICSLTKKGRMPLSSYLLLHRDATLSETDVAALCTWSEKMRDTLQ
jgi:hypothetical protein